MSLLDGYRVRCSKRHAARVYDKALAYARGMGAPELIAACFAEELEGEALSDGSVEPGAIVWTAWAAQNVAACPQCGDPWALFVPCVRAWECQHCPFIWPGEES